jgi:hypothetical protein
VPMPGSLCRGIITKEFWENLDKICNDVGKIAWMFFNQYGFKDKFKLVPPPLLSGLKPPVTKPLKKRRGDRQSSEGGCHGQNELGQQQTNDHRSPQCSVISVWALNTIEPTQRESARMRLTLPENLGTRQRFMRTPLPLPRAREGVPRGREIAGPGGTLSTGGAFSLLIKVQHLARPII